MKRSLAVFLIGCMLAVLTACGKPQTPDDAAVEASAAGEQSPVGESAAGADTQPLSPVDGRSVALILRGADDPFHAAAKEGAKRYAEQWGIKLRCADDLGQLAAVQQAIDQGVDAICISAESTEALEEKLKEARDAGICVSTWDSDVSPDARTLTVAQGSASVLGTMLVEMGVTSLRERDIDVSGEVLYAWHFGVEDSAEEAAWYAAAKDHIRANYPEWVEVDEPYRSDQEEGQAIAVGETLLDDYPAVDLIFCADSAALTGQCRAAQNKGMTAADVTITGFCPPSAMQPYLEAGICTRWGLWDCGMQSAMGCYLAAFLAAGNDVHVGDVVDIPRIGSVEILANSELNPELGTKSVNSGVVLLPERIVFTAENASAYHF